MESAKLKVERKARVSRAFPFRPFVWNKCPSFDGHRVLLLKSPRATCVVCAIPDSHSASGINTDPTDATFNLEFDAVAGARKSGRGVRLTVTLVIAVDRDRTDAARGANPGVHAGGNANVGLADTAVHLGANRACAWQNQ